MQPKTQESSNHPSPRLKADRQMQPLQSEPPQVTCSPPLSPQNSPYILHGTDTTIPSNMNNSTFLQMRKMLKLLLNENNVLKNNLAQARRVIEDDALFIDKLDRIRNKIEEISSTPGVESNIVWPILGTEIHSLINKKIEISGPIYSQTLQNLEVLAVLPYTTDVADNWDVNNNLGTLQHQKCTLLANNFELRETIRALGENRLLYDDQLYAGVKEIIILKGENTQFKEKIMELMQENTKLRACSVGNSQLGKLAKILEYLPIHKKRMLVMENIRMTELEKEIDKLKNIIGKLDRENSAKSKRLEDIEMENAQNIKRLQDLLSEAQEKLLQLLGDKTQLELENQRLLTENENLRSALKLKDLEIEKQKLEIESLKYTIKSLLDKISKLEAQIQELERILGTSMSNTALDQFVADQQKYKNQFKNFYEKLNNELKDKIADLERQLKLKESIIQELQERIKELEEKLKNIKFETNWEVNDAFHKLCMIILSKEKNTTITEEQRQLIKHIFSDNFYNVISTFNKEIEILNEKNHTLMEKLIKQNKTHISNLQTIDNYSNLLLELKNCFTEMEDPDILTPDILLSIDKLKENSYENTILDAKEGLEICFQERDGLEEELANLPLNPEELAQPKTPERMIKDIKISELSWEQSPPSTIYTFGATTTIDQTTDIIVLNDQIERLKTQKTDADLNNQLMQEKIKNLVNTKHKNEGIKKEIGSLREKNERLKLEKKNCRNVILGLQENLKRAKELESGLEGKIKDLEVLRDFQDDLIYSQSDIEGN